MIKTYSKAAASNHFVSCKNVLEDLGWSRMRNHRQSYLESVQD